MRQPKNLKRIPKYGIIYIVTTVTVYSPEGACVRQKEDV
jgi:hypothetical protein